MKNSNKTKRNEPNKPTNKPSNSTLLPDEITLQRARKILYKPMERLASPDMINDSLRMIYYIKRNSASMVQQGYLNDIYILTRYVRELMPMLKREHVAQLSRIFCISYTYVTHGILSWCKALLSTSKELVRKMARDKRNFQKEDFSVVRMSKSTMTYLKARTVRLIHLTEWIEGYYYDDKIYVTSHWWEDFYFYVQSTSNKHINIIFGHNCNSKIKYISIAGLKVKHIGADLTVLTPNEKFKMPPNKKILFDCVVAFNKDPVIVSYLNVVSNLRATTRAIQQKYVYYPGNTGTIYHISGIPKHFYCGAMYLKRGRPRAVLRCTGWLPGAFGFQGVDVKDLVLEKTGKFIYR